MDMLRSDQSPQLHGDSEIVRTVSEQAGVGLIVVERQVLDTTAFSDCLRYCRESRAHTDDSELAVPPEAIALVTEHLSDTLDSGPEIRFIEVLQPVHRQVIFARPELERGRRREPVPAYGSRFAVPRNVMVVRQCHAAHPGCLAEE